MPFTWQININKKAGGFVYDPNPLNDVKVDDQIIWTNNDDKPHFPGLASNHTYFMDYQIPPDSSSDTFIVGVAGPIAYIDSLHPTAPGGTINVS
jgi:hypothetical protein